MTQSSTKPTPKPTDLEPTILVIFGITGDLAQRKLLPALYHLFKDNLLHPDTEIVGISRRDVAVKDMLQKTELCVLEDTKTCDPATIKLMTERLHMYQMDVADPGHYTELRKHLDDLETKHGVCMNRLYYLSIPPQVYGPLIKNLGAAGLNQSCQHDKADTRLLIEKPFGYDLQSAIDLIGEMAHEFKEGQIFRIDHYLAKETVQNILTFRFHNPIFRPIWSAQHISAIDIVANEKIDIEDRANFYDSIGAMRDLIQSHLLQLLAVVTMDHPGAMTSSSIHKTKLALLESIEPVPADKVDSRALRAQYEGYRQEVKNPDSTTETYAAIKLFIENERWRDVPITISTGKALAEKKTAINVHFRHPQDKEHANTLTFAVQPSEGIGVDLWVKKPGFDRELQTASMDFSYQRTFDEQGHPDAYERVLVDAIRGDRTLFATSDEVLASWRIVEPVVQAWSRSAADLQSYKKGSAGPEHSNIQ